MSCKVGNQTNSQDPQAVNSRVFVGNLNTFQCSKTDVERRFQRYGRIAGISMHKGYAFIQFTNPFDARSACLGEDGRLLWGQTLDVNLVAEPKPHQTGRKRQNVAKTGNDWDYYYDSYYAQLGFPTPRLVPPMKRPRIHVPQPPQRTLPNNKPNSPNNKSHSNSNNTSLSELKSYSTPDILICGNCREMFTEVEQLMEHKKTYCKLRFTCKCHMLNGFKAKSPGEEPASLLCSQCKDSFDSAWDLMVHVQAAHMLNIYQLGADTNNKDSLEDIKDDDGIICGNNGGGRNGFVGTTLMSDIDDSGENHQQKSEGNTSQMITGPTSVVGHSTSSYPESGVLSSASRGGIGILQLGNYNPGGESSSMITQYPPRQMNSSSSSVVFPIMEASTQTTTDHPNNNNSFDEQHCAMLATKTEPSSLLLTVANGHA